MINLEELIKTVGIKYQQLDCNGKALGCLAPMYMAFPEEKGHRFDWCPVGMSMRDYMLSLFDRYCERVELDQLQPGDFVTMPMPLGLYHFALYLGNGDMLHATQKRGMEMVKFKLFEKRIERGYRWNGGNIT